jgi:hypothetical protein
MAAGKLDDYPGPAGSCHDVDGSGNNSAQHRCGVMQGLHLDGQVAKYLGQLSVVLSVHQIWMQNGWLIFVAPNRSKKAVVVIF